MGMKEKIGKLKPCAYFVCETDVVSRYLFPQTETDRKSLALLDVLQRKAYREAAAATLIRILDISVLENAS
jgi:hypothetical protein